MHLNFSPIKNKIREDIERYLNNIIPGIHHVLSLYSSRLYGENYLDLLIEEPEKLRDILVSVTGSLITAKIIARILLTPLANMATNKSAEELAELLINNPVDLHRILQEIISLRSSNK
ncbi:MAG: hypothetical protein QXZ41_07790 [Ignisphaera sp.]|uniref:DUF3227 domain-containing protein n=1 Tax=Ignisphaera aggregans TaxID=334771 RepID=A0A7C4JKH7_9CREN